jgi:hypothetical protein
MVAVKLWMRDSLAKGVRAPEGLASARLGKNCLFSRDHLICRQPELKLAALALGEGNHVFHPVGAD